MGLEFSNSVDLGNLLSIGMMLAVVAGGYFKMQATVTQLVKQQADHEEMLREIVRSQRQLGESLVRVTTLVDEMMKWQVGGRQ